jgi:hypothetical protein
MAIDSLTELEMYGGPPRRPRFIDRQRLREMATLRAQAGARLTPARATVRDAITETDARARIQDQAPRARIQAGVVPDPWTSGIQAHPYGLPQRPRFDALQLDRTPVQPRPMPPGMPLPEPGWYGDLPEIGPARPRPMPLPMPRPAIGNRLIDYTNRNLRDIEAQSDIPLVPIRPHGPNLIGSGLSDVLSWWDPGEDSPWLEAGRRNAEVNSRIVEQTGQDPRLPSAAATAFLQPVIGAVPLTSEAREMVQRSMVGKIGGQYGGGHNPWHDPAQPGALFTGIFSGEATGAKGSRIPGTIVHEGAHRWEFLHDVMSTPNPVFMQQGDERPWQERIVRPEWVEAFRANGGQWLKDMAAGEFGDEAGKIMVFHGHFINGKNAEGEDTDGAENFIEQYGALASLAYELNPDDPLSVIRSFNPRLVRFYDGFFQASARPGVGIRPAVERGLGTVQAARQAAPARPGLDFLPAVEGARIQAPPVVPMRPAPARPGVGIRPAVEAGLGTVQAARQAPLRYLRPVGRSPGIRPAVERGLGNVSAIEAMLLQRRQRTRG